MASDADKSSLSCERMMQLRFIQANAFPSTTENEKDQYNLYTNTL